MEIISNTNTEKQHLFYRNTVAKVTLYFAVKYCVLRVSERDVYTCDSPQPLPNPSTPTAPPAISTSASASGCPTYDK